ncbi:MAG: xanthine dehydrogenase family protein molybdopterin-binding subunit [SAR202 cluster bacterium]|nr:oxidoreductase [Chloroflexota bacterium]MQG33366.1 xanthine dehydrogenase family protein molybdopterin-binding subunit [SAR202 cluster bacterium]HCP24786.1 oxidoreductase [Dehalococcoidia bacterium]|tara:strand:- start:1991 stop:4273 length:2283 start_codon:yes stop_codon:yes gene_type:complete
MTSNQVLSDVEYNVVGKRPVRPDGVDKVTGRARYGADTNLTGTLHARVLRSPYPHARIKSIDTAKAEAFPGVKAVVTAKDLPFASMSKEELGDGYTALKYASDHMLASDKALFKGHPVAAVAAVNAHVAEQAIALIQVDYEELQSIVDVREAMKDGSPLVHEDLHTNDMGEMSEKPSNIAAHMSYAVGDTEKGFAEADLVLEREYTTSTVHQGYIEPHNSTAFWNSDGQLNIWTSTQGSFAVRAAVANVLQLPVSQIKVTPMEIGGGFGGKITAYLDAITAVLSKKAGVPVKNLMTRTEVFEASGPAPASWMRVKIGVKNNGRMTAVETDMAMDAGAYPGSPAMQAIVCAFACYDVENGKVDGYDVVVNKPKTAAYRAPGSPQAAFGVESLIDEICEQLKLDPIEFRLLNAAKEGTRRIEGLVARRIGLVECLEAAKNHEHYKTKQNGKNAGRGVACGYWPNRGFQSSVAMTVQFDGTVTLLMGSVDIGGTRASIAQQTAETLGIAYEDVRPTVVDTDSIGYTFITGGSRTSFATGLAAIDAAEDVKAQMVSRAAKIWDTDEDNVEFVNGIISHKSDEELKFNFKDLARQLATTGGTISGRSNVDPTGEGNGYAVHLVDVEVDPDTGKTDVTRYTTIQDAGKAVHPSYVEGQMQGGAVQGIGWALNEEYFFDQDGKMMNPTFLDYRMPTTLDLPMIDTVIVEVPNPGHPYGVRGVGEAAIVPPMAAIGNAIHEATGHRMRSLPMTPGKILEAQWENGKSS